MPSLLDSFLDRSLLFSFDRSGFRRQRRRFRPEELDVDLEGRVCLVTGANSGLGRATARELAARGAEVWLLCRSAERGERALDAIRIATHNHAVHLAEVDLSLPDSIAHCVRRLPIDRVDVLVNNAGVLLDDRRETPEGIELTFATNVLGPFLLTRQLLPRLRRSSDARVIQVSSGGMYAVSLELDDPQWRRRRFGGVKAYAETKRALVELTRQWAERTRGSGITFSSMHPGWADTPGVRRSLPTFHRILTSRLRTPREGSDTIVWLAVSRRARLVNGRFWFDRRPVTTDLLPWTRSRPGDRERLWDLCCELTGSDREIRMSSARADPQPRARAAG